MPVGLFGFAKKTILVFLFTFLILEIISLEIFLAYFISIFITLINYYTINISMDYLLFILLIETNMDKSYYYNINLIST